MTYKGIGEYRAITLTVGADTVAGTSGNDTVNAFDLNPTTGLAAATLNSYDSIDGGAGTDTLNVYATAAVNNSLVGTVKNVEVVNLNGANNIDTGVINAAFFQGSTQINLIGDGSNALAVNGLTSQVLGLKDLDAATLGVPDAAIAANYAATTTEASIALTNSSGAITATGAALATLNVSGSVVADVAATASKENTLTLVDGTATDTIKTLNLSITNNAIVNVDGMDALTKVDASASTGGITLNPTAAATPAITIATILTGAGNDDVDMLLTATATSKTATVTTGAGNDTVSVKVNAGGQTGVTATVDTGAGDDIIDVDSTGTVKVALTAGAGNDKVTLTDGIDSVATTDVVDGGEGTDTVVIAGKTLDAEDYILLRDVVKNFEAIDFTTTAATVDASRMSAYKAFSFADAVGTITKVAADQALTTSIGLTATAAGYVLDSDLVTAGNQTTYAGTLNITAKAGVTVTANAETVNLTVTPVTDKDGAVDNTSVTLTGDAKVANVTLNATTDNANTTASTADDVLETSTLVLDNTGANAALTTLTITGNGSATVTNADTTALVTVDASGLNSVNIAGTAVTGLAYTSTNTKAETIKLGGGLDTVTLTGSTVLKSDTITGLNLVDNAAVAGTQVDATKSDGLIVKSNDGTATLSTFVKTTTTAATLDLALVDLAGSAAGDKLVFQFGGDTYIYADVVADGTAGDNIVNDTDVLVKLTGLVDLDLLVSALG